MKQNILIVLLVVCSYAVDTLKICESGSPLPSVFCGRGPNHQDCPSGYYCNIDPLDRFAVCCAQDTLKICESGSPLPSVFCGRGPNHQDCPSGYYCNIDPLDRFAVCCAQVMKPGTCPTPPSIGLCVELCSSDEECPGRKKCCSNGCGHSCQIPQRLVTSPRTCPRPSGVGICVEQCSSDADCLAGQMCCSNGCGHTCQ